MIRSRELQLEYESRLALRTQIPSDWIVRDKEPDIGIDMEIEIVEKRAITNKILWIQLKATKKIKNNITKISLQIETKHLLYYEGCKIPVVLIYGIKKDIKRFDFYYLFIQKYINEYLNKNNPDWKRKKKISIEINLLLENAEYLNDIATDGYFYLIEKAQQKLLGPNYWFDGIPNSDNIELKKQLLNAIMLCDNEDYQLGIKELLNIIRIYSLTPSQRISILLNLGIAYYYMGQYSSALDNFEAIIKLKYKRTNEILEGIAHALNNIGSIWIMNGKFKRAINYLNKSLKIHKKLGNKYGEACCLGNIGVIYRISGELDKSLKYFTSALRIQRKLKNRIHEAFSIGNIGEVYSLIGEINKSIKFYQAALKIFIELGYYEGIAYQLGCIGSIYLDVGNYDMALDALNLSLKYFKKINKSSEARCIASIGSVYANKGNFIKAIKLLNEALKMHQDIGDIRGESHTLGTLGCIYFEEYNFDKALKYLFDSLRINQNINDKKGISMDMSNIGLVLQYKGEFKEAINYYKDALEIDTDMKNPAGMVLNLKRLGKVHLLLEDLDIALKYFNDSLKLFEKNKYLKGRSEIIDNIILIGEKKINIKKL